MDKHTKDERRYGGEENRSVVNVENDLPVNGTLEQTFWADSLCHVYGFLTLGVDNDVSHSGSSSWLHFNESVCLT